MARGGAQAFSMSICCERLGAGGRLALRDLESRGDLRGQDGEGEGQRAGARRERRGGGGVAPEARHSVPRAPLPPHFTLRPPQGSQPRQWVCLGNSAPGSLLAPHVFSASTSLGQDSPNQASCSTGRVRTGCPARLSPGNPAPGTPGQCRAGPCGEQSRTPSMVGRPVRSFAFWLLPLPWWQS